MVIMETRAMPGVGESFRHRCSMKAANRFDFACGMVLLHPGDSTPPHVAAAQADSSQPPRWKRLRYSAWATTFASARVEMSRCQTSDANRLCAGQRRCVGGR